MERKQYRYVLLALCLFILLLCVGGTLGGSALRLALQPYAWLAEAFYQNSHVYILDTGYMEVHNRYLIGRNCLGTNFTALLFALCGVPYLKYFQGLYKLFWLLSCFVCSILIGFAVNAIRILGSIPFALHEKFNLIHAALGIALYLFTLTLFHIGTAKILERKL